ncbi:glycosyltransferase family 39 protein [Streptomyces sp. RB6PN25]|uniref:Glycosyltransferase family 39 protein n=1 Tax=Streptomyces humicola TaxID=2953240 RepID=A0ABT1PSJ4_9ACTN|nr:glycosyltransferase family 39 protein [Streptomyces humicola]MCQ4079535.1 glycosyltransferase family 39 protein [Streptomyces humicola]
MATIPVTREPATHRRRSSRRATPRQGSRPAWELPALLLVLTLATVLYTWGIGHASIHPFYSAAVRSMSTSWRAFLYGGLDPGGSITVDKIPGALWPQAASVWLFGPHNWAVALPQVIEGLLTVWMLYRIVRAWAGQLAGLLAALVLTLTPVTVVLTRNTIPDTLLTLLLVLAAGSLQKAARTGRLLPLLVCGVWVGLAFQAKMLQAWLVLPVFAVVHLLGAPGSVVRRGLQVLAGGITALAVSCSWLLLVWVTPAADRPYLDGTTNNNPFTLVFGYNGLSRFGKDPSALGAVSGTAASRTTGNTGWTMLVNHTVGPQIAWLLPLAVMAAVLGVVWRKGQPRTDALRAGYLLWGGWLAVHAVVFSSSNGNHGYYTAVFAPALAALAGGGLAVFRSAYEEGGARRAVLPVAIGLTAVWAAILDSGHTAFAAWLLPVPVLLGLCGALGLWSSGPRTSERAVRAAFATGVAAVLTAPAVWAVSSLDPLYAGASTSPLAGPVGSSYLSMLHHGSGGYVGLHTPSARDAALLGYLTAHRDGAQYLLATQAAYSAEPLLRATSQPMLVMGGFTGVTPFPTVEQLSDLVSAGRLRYALLTTARPSTPDTAWVTAHCTRIPPSAFGRTSAGSFTLYDCGAARR